MTCSFCGARNNESESRCRKCGRRPDDSLNTESTVRTEGALATKLALAQQAETEDWAAQRAIISGVQQDLFGQPKVVPISVYAPLRAEPKSQPRKAVPRRKPVVEGQGALDFLPPEPPKPRTLSTTVEAMVSCEAPVATAMHRFVAAAIDGAMIVMAYALFLGVYFALGGEFRFDKLNLEIFGGALVLVGLAYGSVWTVAGADTAGMYWTGLRLSTFEGFPVEPRQRVLRFLAGCLSMCTVVGHLWCLADEESLTWHDHMSRTFPTPRRVRAEVFRRV